MYPDSIENNGNTTIRFVAIVYTFLKKYTFFLEGSVPKILLKFPYRISYANHNHGYDRGSSDDQLTPSCPDQNFISGRHHWNGHGVAIDSRRYNAELIHRTGVKFRAINTVNVSAIISRDAAHPFVVDATDGNHVHNYYYYYRSTANKLERASWNRCCFFNLVRDSDESRDANK